MRHQSDLGAAGAPYFGPRPAPSFPFKDDNMMKPGIIEPKSWGANTIFVAHINTSRRVV